MPVEITSRQNAVVKACRALMRGRDGDRVLLDGLHLIEDALEAGVVFESIIASHSLAAAEPRLIASLDRHALTYVAADDVLGAASPVRTPAGIVANSALTRTRTGVLVLRYGSHARYPPKPHKCGQLGPICKSRTMGQCCKRSSE